MSNNFQELILHLKIPKQAQETVNNLTNQLLELNQSPAVFQQLFASLFQLDNLDFARASTVFIKQIVSFQSQFIIANPEIMASFVDILSKWDDRYIIENIVHGLSPIIEAFGESWTDLIQLAISGFSQPNRFVASLTILTEVLPFVKENFLLAQSASFFGLLNQILSSDQNNQVILLCFQVFLSLFVSDLSIQYTNDAHEVFLKLLKYFQVLLYKSDFSEDTSLVAVIFSSLFKHDYFAEDRVQIFHFIFSEINFQQVTEENRQYFFFHYKNSLSIQVIC